MDFLRTALHWAGVAWNIIAGIPSDIGQAFDHVWRFVGSLFSLLSHLGGRILRDVTSGYLQIIFDIINELDGQSRAIDRVRFWIYKYYIVPLRTFLLWVIARFVIALNRRIEAVKALAVRLYIQSLAFTNRQVGIERSARIADVRAARAYADKLVKALHSAIEAEASNAYNAHTPDRVSVLTKVIDEIANRNPAVRGLVKEFVTVLLDLIGTENPVFRFALNLILPRIISGLGVDKALGDLLTSLLGPLAGTPKAHSLADSVSDLAQRVGAIEGQWTQFMVDGGPEVEQAGEQWKELTSVGVSVSLLAFFGLAVADPAGWATAIADTAGAAVNDSAAAVAQAIRKL